MDSLGYCAFVVLAVFLLQDNGLAAPVADTDGTDNALNGEFLLDLGRNFSNPLLRLIGQVFLNYKETVATVEPQLMKKLCELHPCTEWESWTSCPAVVRGQFSMVSRSRNCNRTDEACTQKTNNDFPTEETEVCEGWCPKTYEVNNDYCLKLVKSNVNQSTAQAACQEDNGHLINMDTRAKFNVVQSFMKNHGITSHRIWINGFRTSIGGDWEFTYGSKPDFDNWRSGQPTDGSTELCRIESNSKRQWYDQTCYSSCYYVCEVIHV